MLKKRIISPVSFVYIILVALTVFSYGCVDNIKQQIKPNATQPAPIHPKDEKREIILSKARNVVVIYFATADKRNLLPVTLDVNPTEEMAKLATEKLLAGPADETLQNPIPEGTKLKDLYKFENVAYVDLTSDFLNYKTTEEAEMAVKALVLTLTEFPQVDSVQILIGGKVPEKLYGTTNIAKALQRPKKTNFYGKEGKNLFKVYYVDANAMYLVPITLSSSKEVSAQLVVQKLLQDPPKESNLGASPIWPGTKLINVSVSNGIVTVNLSKEVLGYGGGAANEINLINSLAFTLTDLPGINKVQLYVEGKKIEYLPEGTDVGEPFERPDKINYFQK